MYHTKGNPMDMKEYGWKGWKMPILHLGDPDYCELGCPICRSAREGNRLAIFIQRIQMALTFGGCRRAEPDKENTV